MRVLIVTPGLDQFGDGIVAFYQRIVELLAADRAMWRQIHQGAYADLIKACSPDRRSSRAFRHKGPTR
jgi:hypothetical protein